MNSKSTQLVIKILATLSLVFAFNFGFACDRTSISLDSIVATGAQYNIYITQNVGAGITGSVRGADNSTFTFAYSFWGNPTLSISAFSPSVTSDFTATTNNGLNVGPFLGSNFTIGYISPGTPFTCVSSTAGCGNVHTDIKQVVFTLNEIPDSIRLYGIEGSGNPVSGCFPDADMLVDFSTLPVVWSSFNGVAENNEVQLTWGTSQETNTDFFSVLRSTDGVNFEELGTLEAAGNTNTLTNYNFVDDRPIEGSAFYKISQYDLDGQFTSTEVIQVVTDLDLQMAWTHVGPNPVEDATQLGFTVTKDQSMTLQVFNLSGQIVYQEQLQALRGSNAHTLDMNGIAPGMFVIRLSSPSGKLDKKIIKL